ncbi:Protein spire -like protein 1 [Triplophysa tibetana]|uniref:Protein spire-like protein 1 n=1 Tax=Triplophysa tibetana TaxID=1572043 RepID=A0A5A9NNF2_9TELE|nr:Protein spire -like protein 1 [Triplophysa tibetana]
MNASWRRSEQRENSDPVSPDMMRRSRLVIRPLSMSVSFDSSGAGKSMSTPQDLFRCSDVPDGPRKLAISTLSLANGSSPPQSPKNSQPLSQRKRLLKAPRLDELNSSDSDEDQKSSSSSSISTSVVDDTSPESVRGKKIPQFLPTSSSSQPDKRIGFRDRNSTEKDALTSLQSFLPPSRPNSKSQEEFCYPVECLTLTVEEVMHIRQVLVKAELEKFQPYKDVYNALKKGKMKLPSKPHARLPISSFAPSMLPKSEPGASSQTEKTSTTSGQKHHSLQRSMSRSSKHGERSSFKDDLELPEQLTEDWITMDVCGDCRKFIHDIITNSRRSQSTKRARLHRRTHSVYMSSTSSSKYRPTERTIKEI